MWHCVSIMTALFGLHPEMLVLPLMYVGIGFLFAALIAVAFSPAIHRRAERLTKRRLNEIVPASVLEMRAIKDQLRAEHARAERELQTHIDKLREKTALQGGELGRKTEALHRLQIAFDQKTGTLAALERRATGLDPAGEDLHGDLSIARFEANASRAALREAEDAIRAMQSDIAELTAAVESRSRLIDRQQHDIMALTAQIDRISSEPPAIAPVVAQAAMTKQHEMRAPIMPAPLAASVMPAPVKAAPAKAVPVKAAPVASAPAAQISPGVVSFQARLAAIRDDKPLRDVRAAVAAKPAILIAPAPQPEIAHKTPVADPQSQIAAAPKPEQEPGRVATDIRYDEPLSTADLLELGKAMLRQSATDGPPHRTH